MIIPSILGHWSSKRNWIDRIRFPESASIGAALLGSVLLASRLKTQFDVFIVMSASVFMFGVWPDVQQYIRVIELN
jgi:hypothetical protein